jgi:hypothetical protein
MEQGVIATAANWIVCTTHHHALACHPTTDGVIEFIVLLVLLWLIVMGTVFKR